MNYPTCTVPGRSPHPASPLFQNVTEALGMVPIVRLNRIDPLCQHHELYLKLESCNPGGSIKEKNAAFLITQAEQQGWLRPGGTIIESSSGNFGIGLAMVGAMKGYKVKIVIDAKTSPTMVRMLQAYGAELIEVPLSAADAQGSMQVARMERAQTLADAIPNAWYVCQHKNPNNPTAHGLYTAREIEAAFNGAPDAIVIGISTSGQLSGIAAVLGGPRHGYKMTGLGLSFIPPNFNPDHLDRAYSITDQLAFSVCHQLATREGLLLGASTGAIVAAALADAHQQTIPQRMLLLNPDRGDRYLETVYNPDWLAQQQISLLEEGPLSRTIHALQPVELKPLS